MRKLKSALITILLVSAISAASLLLSSQWLSGKSVVMFNEGIGVLDDTNNVSITVIDYRKGLFRSEFTLELVVDGIAGELHRAAMMSQGLPGESPALMVNGQIEHGPIVKANSGYKFAPAFMKFEINRPNHLQSVILDPAQGPIAGLVEIDYSGNYYLEVVTSRYSGDMRIDHEPMQLTIRPSKVSINGNVNDLGTITANAAIGDISMLEGDEHIYLNSIATHVDTKRQNGEVMIDELNLSIGSAGFKARSQLDGYHDNLELSGLDFNAHHIDASESSILSIEQIDISNPTTTIRLRNSELVTELTTGAHANKPHLGSARIRVDGIKVVNLSDGNAIDDFLAKDFSSSMRIDEGSHGIYISGRISADILDMNFFNNETNIDTNVSLGYISPASMRNFQDGFSERLEDTFGRYDHELGMLWALIDSFNENLAHDIYQNGLVISPAIKVRSREGHADINLSIPIDLSIIDTYGIKTGILWPQTGMTGEIDVSASMLQEFLTSVFLSETESNSIINEMINGGALTRSPSGYRTTWRVYNEYIDMNGYDATDLYISFISDHIE